LAIGGINPTTMKMPCSISTTPTCNLFTKEMRQHNTFDAHPQTLNEEAENNCSQNCSTKVKAESANKSSTMMTTRKT